MNSPIAYVGGKSKLAETIIRYIPQHHTYIEVFAGGAWIFFRKEPSNGEVLNDKDGDLISLYRVIQNHLEEFLKQFKWLLTSRETFYDFKNQIDGRGLTDIQRAAKYYYLQRLCFGGRVLHRSFGVDASGGNRINLVRMEEELSSVHLRLSNVIIENLSWENILQKYDKPDNFFYLDPPYFCAPCYKHNFENLSEYETLSTALSGLQGKFLLSINDLPEIRDVFQNFNILPVEVPYSIGKDDQSIGKELLISNYELKENRQGNLFDE